MTLEEARKLSEGAIVRRSWFIDDPILGMILSKKHVRERHTARTLGIQKNQRYDFKVCWLTGTPEVLKSLEKKAVYQNWELMIVSKG